MHAVDTGCFLFYFVLFLTEETISKHVWSMKHLFYFLYSDALKSLGLAVPGRIAPPRISQFLEMVNVCFWACLANANQWNAVQIQNPEPTPPISLLTLRAHPPALVTPETGTRQEGQSLPQSLLEWISLASNKSVYPAFQSGSHGNHKKGSCPRFPSPSCHSWSFPTMWPTRQALSSENCE